MRILTGRPLRFSLLVFLIAFLCTLTGCDDSSSSPSSSAPANVSSTFTGQAVSCTPVLDPPTGQHGHELTVNGDVVRFLLFIPRQYAEQDAWPLILFLHGSGERGTNVDSIKKHGTPRYVDSNPSFPFIVVSPQLPTSLSRWETSALADLLDEVVCRYAVDVNRIYVTGLSMGGIGTWAMAISYPDKIAAIAPVSGWGFPDEAATIRHIPAWVFHGSDDTAVPLRRAQEMVDALRAVGGNVTFTVYPGLDHSDTWPPTYEASALYDWFLGWSL